MGWKRGYSLTGRAPGAMAQFTVMRDRVLELAQRPSRSNWKSSGRRRSRVSVTSVGVSVVRYQGPSSGHRSHFKNKCVTSCGLSRHAALFPHPEIVDSRPVDFLKVIFLETVKDPKDLLRREVWWQLYFGTLSGKDTEVFSGLNDRKDFNAI